MPDTIENVRNDENESVQEAVCVHTSKIFDSCKDRDCLDDLRVYLTENSQNVVNSATGVRPRSAELLFVDTAVEPVQFNRGFYTVDLSFYYRVKGETIGLGCSGTPISGLSFFSKRVLLYGSEGNAKIFSSDRGVKSFGSSGIHSYRLPTAVVEAVDPILLDLRLVEPHGKPHEECEVFQVPEAISALFDSPIVFSPPPRRVFATLGQFSIVRLERDTQLLIPAYDYCVPDKECVGADSDDPCTLFNRIDFPVDEFFPPDSLTGFSETYRGALEELNG